MDTKAREISGVIVVQPSCEPWPSGIVRIGRYAAFFYVRILSWSIGIELLSGGAAVFVGPLMFGIVHIQRALKGLARRAEL